MVCFVRNPYHGSGREMKREGESMILLRALCYYGGRSCGSWSHPSGEKEKAGLAQRVILAVQQAGHATLRFLVQLLSYLAVSAALHLYLYLCECDGVLFDLFLFPPRR